MRVLREDLLRKLCRAKVEELEFLHLDRQNIEQLGDALETAVALVVLRARHNSLASVPRGALDNCRALWRLDLSWNRLTDVSGLAAFAALGALDLSCNLLAADALAPLAAVDVVQLRLAGNPELVAKGGEADDAATAAGGATVASGAAGPGSVASAPSGTTAAAARFGYADRALVGAVGDEAQPPPLLSPRYADRALVLARMPGAWVLDDHFVAAEEVFAIAGAARFGAAVDGADDDDAGGGGGGAD